MTPTLPLILLSTLLQPAAQPAKPTLKPPPAITPVPIPSDAVIYFDGSSLDNWTTRDKKPAAWSCEKKPGTAMTVVPKTGDIVSTKTFGSAQIHLEFMEPITEGKGQDRGNSGLYIHGRYELQILDSFNNETYPDGQCGAIYQQHIPLVNACRPPGEWQTYDIIFHAAKFDANDSSKKTAPARITVLHNGILIQDNAELKGPTGGAVGQQESPTGPLLLQEHGHEVKFRNIWVRPI